MKKRNKLMTIMIATLILIGSIQCNSHGPAGPCIGAFDEKDPSKIYKLDGWNVFMGVLFSSCIVPPIIVLKDQTFCPVSDK